MTGLSPENRDLINADAELSANAWHGGFSSAVSLLSIGASQAVLERLLNAARDEGRRAAYSTRLCDHIVRRIHELRLEGKQAIRLELPTRDRVRLAAEFDHTLSHHPVVRLATTFGSLDIVEAPRAAICWRRNGRSYGSNTWERETL